MARDLKEIELPEWAIQAERALKEAVSQAIAEHWKAGNPVYVWRDERIVALLPDGTSIPLAPGQYSLDEPADPVKKP